MSTDIYLSKGILEQFSFSTGWETDIGLYHDPCGVEVFEACDTEDKNAWKFMEAMSKHSRECEAGRGMKPKPSPGLYIPESEIKRG